MSYREFCADNIFFHRDYNNLRILLLVPHQDDEINTAGALAATLSKSGADIILVYTTNGDWKYPAETRIREAVNAAGVLGIKRENIVFLGYGDAINSNEHNHLFYHKEPIESPSGHKETYGSEFFHDYAYLETGNHNEYTNINFLNDIISVIKKYQPDLIICTDFDEHPDHRMLSLYLDRAIGIIRKDEYSYTPEIWKRFAYSTGYTAEADYTAINNPETKRPEVRKTGKYAWDLIDTSIYSWNERIRIPIPKEMRIGDLKKNLLAIALKQHKSQYIITKANRIINSDEVYWSRRTDSVAYSADISVSSGEGHYLNDFLIYDTEDVDSIVPDISGHCWTPEVGDEDRRAVLTWKAPQHVEEIVLYGEITDKSAASELIIRLSDGYEKYVRNIPTNGNPVRVDTGSHDDITECSIEIMKSSGAGITEIEVYAEKEKQSLIQPFAKILIEGNFVYEYILDSNVRKLDISLYGYETKGVQITVAEGKSEIVDDKLYLNVDDNEIVLQASTDNGIIIDQVVIQRKSQNEIKRIKAIDKANIAYLQSMQRKMKIHNMLYILRHDGVGAVAKRTLRNVIRPMFMRK